jgi:EAL domain-containing protein (putative c-di-GMP-specific phosphodiesterase class I)
MGHRSLQMRITAPGHLQVLALVVLCLAAAWATLHSPTIFFDSTLVIARKLGLQTMAEGVETQAQYQALKELGCDSFQGYLFGQPMPADALAALL